MSPPHQKLRPATVPNPLFSRAHPADASNPRTIPVAVTESAITMLASRGTPDAAQIRAATRFRSLPARISGSAVAADMLRMSLDDLAGLWGMTNSA
ncbi:hypothetical protein NKH10_19735 [Mesorhizobium sp. M1340]|uniref:hypothetical protein n=1 Tax=unclassified Mesorhizobium TaxID=325217 RepID=UPI00333A0535